jgi:hypothetical protein
LHARFLATGGAPAARRRLCGPCGHGILASVGARVRTTGLGHAEAALRSFMTSARAPVTAALSVEGREQTVARRGTRRTRLGWCPPLCTGTVRGTGAHRVLALLGGTGPTPPDAGSCPSRARPVSALPTMPESLSASGLVAFGGHGVTRGVGAGKVVGRRCTGSTSRAGRTAPSGPLAHGRAHRPEATTCSLPVTVSPAGAGPLGRASSQPPSGAPRGC